jgi:predicted transcriptional regulator
VVVGETDDEKIARPDDTDVEATVLRQLLLIHPTQVTVEELIRDIAVDAEEFAERDAIERAVRDLARAGLLHRNGEFAIPSRAALRFNELLGG